MDTAVQFLSMVLAAPPQVLALLLGLASIGVAGFALYVVHAAQRRDRS